MSYVDWNDVEAQSTPTSGGYVDWNDVEKNISQPLPAGMTPSNAGGGRGGLGGPTAQQIASATPTVNVNNRPVATPGSDQELREAGVAGLTGLVHGATLGTSKYATAGMTYLADKARGLMSNNPGMSWNQALEFTRQELESQAEQHPIAYHGGNVAGAVANAVATGGTSTVPQLVGRGAIQGGVSGFSNNENLGEAATGAGIGAALGGVAGGANTAIKYAGGKIMKSTLVKNAEEALANAKDYLPQSLKKVLGTADEAQKLRAAAVTGSEEAADYIRAKAVHQSFSSMKTDQITPDMVQMANMFANQQAKTGVRETAKTFAKNVIPGAVEGGVGGAAIGALSGQDPVQSAKIGALLGSGYGAAKGRIIQGEGNILGTSITGANPNTVANVTETGARLGTSLLTAQVPRTLFESNQQLSDLFNSMFNSNSR